MLHTPVARLVARSASSPVWPVYTDSLLGFYWEAFAAPDVATERAAEYAYESLVQCLNCASCALYAGELLLAVPGIARRPLCQIR